MSRIVEKIEHGDSVTGPIARWIAADIILKFYGHVVPGAKSDDRIITVAAPTVFFLQTHNFARSAKASCFELSDLDALIDPDKNENNCKNTKKGGSFFITLELF